MAITVSRDGRYVYAVAAEDKALSVFSRDVGSGRLTQHGVLRNGVDGVQGMGGYPYWVAASGDGANVYVVDANHSTMAPFRRDVGTGMLVSMRVVDSAEVGVSSRGPMSVVVSLDDRYVYVAGRQSQPSRAEGEDGAVCVGG